MLFYGTPILYSLSQFNDAGILARLIQLNPLTTIMNAYRDGFLYHQWPDMSALLIVTLFSFVVLIIGYIIFKKLEKRICRTTLINWGDKYGRYNCTYL